MSDPTLQLVAGLILIVLIVGVLLAQLSLRSGKTKRIMREIEERARPRYANPRHPEKSPPRNVSGLDTTAFGANRPQRLATIAKLDPNFSELDFLEMAAALYTWAHRLRPRRDYLTLRAFLAEPALDTFLSGISDLDSVADIRVGEVRPTRVYVDAEWASVELSFRAVQIERIKDEYQEVWRVENWRLRRRADVVSPGREVQLALGCPHCGSTKLVDEKGNCSDCGRLRSGPAVQWQVAAIGDVRRNPSPPQPPHLPLGPAVPPTPLPDDLELRLEQFRERNPGVGEGELREAAIAALQRALGPEGVDLDGPLGRKIRLEAEQLAATHQVRHLVLGGFGAATITGCWADATHDIVELSMPLDMRVWFEREESVVPTESLPYLCELTLARPSAGTWLPIELRWVEPPRAE